MQIRMAQHIQEQKLASFKQQQEEAQRLALDQDALYDQLDQEPPHDIKDYIGTNTQEDLEDQLTKLSAKVPTQAAADTKPRKMVYFSYNYRGGIPGWVKPLKEALENLNYLAFSPLDSVEEQFQEEHKKDLFGLNTKLVSSLVGFLKLPEEIIAPLDSQSVIQHIRVGDQRTDIDALMFKEIYFLTRSSVVICDLIQEPYGFEILHKLFICKILDIPTIAISPKGAPLNPYVSKFVKIVLTDEFNVANVLPLVRAYT